jgi:MFS family permease
LFVVLLVAFCSDLGVSRSSALMLSVLLGTAFLSRQVWGAVSDRIGGLATVLIGSAWQAASVTAFLLTLNEAGLFVVAAAFGLGFSGIIPAYVLVVRELFPASEASWRIPTLLLFSGEAWLAAAGSPVCSTTISDIMRPRSPSASAPTFSTCLWSACWSGGNATARSRLERSKRAILLAQDLSEIGLHFLDHRMAGGMSASGRYC